MRCFLIESMHRRIKKAMQSRISHLPEGTRLPSEMELCAEFGVSRMTVNKVIAELAKEGYVTRLRRWGTTVRRPPSEQRVITFLLPCPDSLLLNDFASAERRHLLSGILRAVRETGSRLETVPVSPTNSPRDIDFSSLRHLNEKSLVIVSSVWYIHAFEALRHSGARILLIDKQIAHTWEKEWQHTKEWLISEMDHIEGTAELVRRLHARGCRRIAAISPYLFEGQPWLIGYRDAVGKLGLPELICNLPAPSPALTGSDRAYLETNACDGVLLFMHNFRLIGNTVNEALALPDSIQVAGIFYDGEFNFIRTPFPSFHFSCEHLGYEAVMRLLHHDGPRVKTYPPCYGFACGKFHTENVPVCGPPEMLF